MEIIHKLSLHIIVYLIFTYLYTTLSDSDFITNGSISKEYNRYYYSAITHTTIGYGDISPKSTKCKLITMAHAFAVLILWIL